MATKNNSVGLDSIGVPSETGVVYLYHPVTDEPLYVDDAKSDAMWIEVYGLDSDHYKKVQNNQTNRRLQKAQRSGGRASITAEQQEAMNLDLMAKCVKSWNIVLGGDQPECNEENARSLFQIYPWVRDQVWDFMHDRKAFLKG